MKAGIVVNVVNVVLNFLLIYPTRRLSLLGFEFTMPGADMGVIGAAVASAIAFVVGGILITVAMWKHPMVSPRGQKLRPDPTILKPCFKVAFPNMLQRFGRTRLAWKRLGSNSSESRFYKKQQFKRTEKSVLFFRFLHKNC